jgi:hypothetical protein
MSRLKAAVIYRGPSLIDGQPIVAIATLSGRNRKTGRMLQTYILRSDIDPMAANKSGADRSICGDCPHRGTPTTDPARKLAVGRTCYVVLAQGVSVVWKAFCRGVYPSIEGHDAIAGLGDGHMVRIGTYGDGAAVPSYVWESLISRAKGHTAYSHQKATANAAFVPHIYMQSVDSLDAANDAWIAGNRTFRVVRSVADIVKGREVLCPASKEAGRRTTCASCGLCGGTSVHAKSVAIPAHGQGVSHFQG